MFHLLGFMLPCEGDLLGARKALEGSLATRTDPLYGELLPDVAALLGQLGRVLRRQGVLAGARSALERSGHAIQASFNLAVLVHKGVGDFENALRLYDGVIARHADDADVEVKECVFRPFYNKAIALSEMGRHAEAIGVCDCMVARFGDAAEAARVVAMALRQKGHDLERLGRLEEALRVYGGVAPRFGGSDDATLREQVSMALFGKGTVLRTLGRPEEALRAFEEVLIRFPEALRRALSRRRRSGDDLNDHPPSGAAWSRRLHHGGEDREMAGRAR